MCPHALFLQAQSHIQYISGKSQGSVCATWVNHLHGWEYASMLHNCISIIRLLLLTIEILCTVIIIITNELQSHEYVYIALYIKYHTMCYM